MRPHDKFHFVCALGSRCYYVPLPAVRFLASRCYPCQQCVSLLAGATLVRSCFPMALRHGAPASSTSLAPRLLLPINALAGNLHMGAPAVAPIGAPAGNKPHLAEKRTPVWLAIWHTWAGFANSQLLPDASALSSMQGLPWSGNSSAQPLRRSAPASNIFPMVLRPGTLARRQPHSAEKRTPVWLAIWRI